MKKLITLAVALVCVLALSVSVFAGVPYTGGDWVLSGDNQNCYSNPITGTAEGLSITAVSLPADHDILITFNKELKAADLSSLEIRYYFYTINDNAIRRPFFTCANGGSSTFVNQPAFLTGSASVVDGKLAIDIKDPNAVIKMGTADSNVVLADFRDCLDYASDNNLDWTVGLRVKNGAQKTGDYVGLIESTDGTGLPMNLVDGANCAFLPVSEFVEETPDTPSNPSTGDTTIAAIACAAIASAAALAFVSTTRKKEH